MTRIFSAAADSAEDPDRQPRMMRVFLSAADYAEDADRQPRITQMTRIFLRPRIFDDVDPSPAADCADDADLFAAADTRGNPVAAADYEDCIAADYAEDADAFSAAADDADLPAAADYR